MGMSIAEWLFAAALAYGLFKLLKPLQQKLEKTLTKISKGKPGSKERVIDLEPENKKKGS